MRRFMLCLALFLFVGNVGRADPFTLDDVKLWVGTGSNRAALIVDFKNGSGSQSFAWGFRWNGTATGADMVRAIAASNDAGLRVALQHFSFGDFIVGFGFDANRDGQFAVAPPLNFINGIAEVSSPDKTRVSTDPADRYRELEFPDFWSYWNKASATDPWTSASAGIGDRILTDGSFDGFSAVNEFPGPEPSEPIAVAAVPEPSSVVLLILTGLMLLAVRRMKRPINVKVA